MKKNSVTILLLTIMSVVLFSSCKSKETKALDLIDQYMKTVLIDYDSYEVNSIKIDSAYTQMYMDIQISTKAKLITMASDEFDKAKKNFDSDMESMDIWSPGMYSSSYSRSKYQEAKENADMDLEAMKHYLDIMKGHAAEMKESIAAFESEFIGWGCTVSYRCKTAGGLATLNTGYFVVDKSYKELLYEYTDINDDEFKSILDVIDKVQYGYYDDEDEDEE